MTIDEAKKINAEVYGWCIGHLLGQPPEAPPPDYLLRDMLEASDMMQGYSEPSTEPGRIYCFPTVDPRMIAAMYVLAQYAASPLDEVDPIIVGDGKVVLVVKVKDLISNEETDYA